MKKLMDTLFFLGALLLFYWILSDVSDYAKCRVQGKQVVNGGFHFNCK